MDFDLLKERKLEVWTALPGVEEFNVEEATKGKLDPAGIGGECCFVYVFK